MNENKPKDVEIRRDMEALGYSERAIRLVVDPIRCNAAHDQAQADQAKDEGGE